MTKKAFVLAFLCVPLVFACAKTSPPATSPYVSSGEPARAWLTVQHEGQIIAWREIAGELSEEILKKDPLPAMPDVKEFAPAFLAETEVSADGVTVVRSVGESFADPFRKLLNATLEEKRHPRLSRRGFKKALRDGQLTCHFAATTVRPQGNILVGDNYACVEGLECTDNLLFSLTPPEDQGKITASIALLGVEGNGGNPCVFGLEDTSEHASTPPDVAEEGGPWLIEWEALLPILQGLTGLGDTGSRRRGFCLGNIPPEAGVDMRIAYEVEEALTEYAHRIGGREEGIAVFLDLVAGVGPAPPLWEDPCLPQEIAPLLFKERIGILIPAELLAACAAMRRSLPEASHAEISN